jgi:cob(I)alamin adenosyltransferase
MGRSRRKSDLARWNLELVMSKQNRRGLLIINTGNGKGKTTAALGLVLRAWGHGLKVCVIQFIKGKTGRWGEVRAAEKLEIEWHSSGEGRKRGKDDRQAAKASALAGWEMARKKIINPDYDLIVLDELTYLFKNGWLDTDEVVKWLSENRPVGLHLVITGRYAPNALIDYADLVTEMRVIKHPYREQGIRSQKGVDY